MNSLWDIRIFLGLVPKESPGVLSYSTKNQSPAYRIFSEGLLVSYLYIISIIKINQRCILMTRYRSVLQIQGDSVGQVYILGGDNSSYWEKFSVLPNKYRGILLN
jgi:hypothetical protein